jgi:hypothetical protein
MNQSQTSNIINLCNQIDNIEIANTLFGYGVTNIGIYDIHTFQSLTRRITKQLIDEFQNGLGQFLPNQYNYGNEFGSGVIESDLQSFINYLQNSSSYPNIEQIFNKLIYYQIANGFWDRGQRKIYSANEVKVKEIQFKISSLEKLSSTELERLKIQRQELIDFIEQKRTELQLIERNVNTSNLNNQEIANLLNQSTANNERINSVLTQQQLRTEESKQFLDEKRNELIQVAKEYDAQKQQFEEQSADISKKQSQFQEILDFVISKEKYFKERNEYLDNLIGREVGASLFETFKQRKIELESPVNFWKWSVPVMSVITVGWIYFLFMDFSSISDIYQKWQFFALNTIKTIPAIILTYFVINQYRKERNFQEEYAFKSAVALTISEYANKLMTPENKDKLIMESVSSVFISPIERRLKREEMKNNAFNDAVKSLKDVVTEIADKVKK